MALPLQSEAGAETAPQQPWPLLRGAHTAAAPQLLLPLASGPQVAPTRLPVLDAPEQMGRRCRERPSECQEGALQGLSPAAGGCPTAGSPSISLLPASRQQQRAARAPPLLLQEALKAGGCPPLRGRGARRPSRPQLEHTSTRMQMVGGKGPEAVSCPLPRGRAARGHSKHQPGRSGRGLGTVCCLFLCSKGAWGSSQLQRGRSSRTLGTACCPLQGGRGACLPSQAQLDRSERAALRLCSNATHRGLL